LVAFFPFGRDLPNEPLKILPFFVRLSPLPIGNIPTLTGPFGPGNKEPPTHSLKKE
jgi:hypothetical protein